MERSIERSEVGVTVGLAVVWLVAAFAVEGTTFHLAPVLVAGSGPVLVRRSRLGGLALGLVVTATVTGVLAVAGRLDGPSLLPWGGAMLETVLGAAMGAVAGILLPIIGGRGVSGSRHNGPTDSGRRVGG